jgi:lipoyl(octanoyl) transferase
MISESRGAGRREELFFFSNSKARERGMVIGPLLTDASEEILQSGNATVRFLSLPGNVPYEQASDLQRELVDARYRGEIPDTVLFLEHAPVITRGRGLQWTGAPRAERQMPAPSLLPPGMSFCESERGGDLTYHGPGQLVAYPILKLEGEAPWAPARDISLFLRGMEGWLLRSLERGYGLRGESRPGATGVWVGDRKIASIGVAVRRWVTWHGIALNAVNDLAPFHLISPCGFAPEVMTRLQDQAPTAVRGANWREDLEATLREAWLPS